MLPPLVLVTRPIEQAGQMAEKIRALGFCPVIQPLLDILPVRIDLKSIPRPDALVMSSPQALKFYDIPDGWPDGWMDIPVFAVGEATAISAKKKGFKTVVAGQAGIDRLPSLMHEFSPPLSPKARILYLRGANITKNISRILPDYDWTEVVTYRAEQADKFLPHTVQKFPELSAILIFSERTAEAFCNIVIRSGLENKTKNISLFTLSPSVLKSCQVLQWKTCYSADAPTQDSVIELLQNSILTQDA